MPNQPSAPTILLDVSRLVWRAWEGKLPTGIDRTCLAYVARYHGWSQAVVQHGGHTKVLSREVSERLYDIILTQGAEGVRLKLLSLAVSGLLGRRESDLAGRAYLNVGHTGLDKPGHSAWLTRSRVRPVYFVHDLIPITHPEYCRPGEFDKHRRRVVALLRQGIGIIGNSRDTLNDVAVFAGRQALCMPPAVVAPLGVADPPQRLSGSPNVALPDRLYFVMLGTIEGRKNHLLILTLWAELARRLGSACPKLVIIGQRGWECEQVVDMLERCETIRGHVVELSRCDDATLSTYMRGAQALLFPSFVEGYGLPLVEALAAGTPVIASDLTVFRELAGDIPDYFSPIDGIGWMRAIESYTNRDSPMRAAQLKRLRGWMPPTWDTHFATVDQWLEPINQMRKHEVPPND